ncbi:MULTISPECIES: aromatic ring-opening dioxygenase LigA [Streptomyces]|uniref:Uncharacterized protein n=2 Tax=Streptomyces TaxID=1883 RepID=A0A100Y667_9ACTN|nr:MULTISPECIES: aromatic ring-opening dioxygenase LigA [Streptomyces]KUH38414.1 hypothetical protein ATE80_13170 [Streptomyces kanasensis]UUS30861.1 aromatic ring-opening dioxygenase LigA [Streptomyces changanensis]
MSALDRARRLLDEPPPPQVPGQLAADLPALPRPHPPLVCDVPQPRHDGRVRPYPCGPRCDHHAPRPRPAG